MDILDCNDKSDGELVDLVFGNQDYFACLVNRYENKLSRYVLRIAGKSCEIEDVLQEVFLKVYQNLNGFDRNLKFSSWIYRITHNLVIDKIRRKKVQPQVVDFEEKDDFMANITAEDGRNPEAGMDVDKEIISEILSKMKDKYKNVLILKFLEDKSYEEISDILKIPMGTVATLINRGKKSFRKITSERKIEF